MPLTEDIRFQFHRLRHELGNYSLLRQCRSDGLIVSMHQSGTHWLKFMLASAMSKHFRIPPPRYNHANDIIGGPKQPAPAKPLPHFISSHSIPPLIVQNRMAASLLNLPPTVLLIRDIRHSLLSNYDKWQQRYQVSFSTFMQGDPAGRRYNSDIWWCIRFLNAWGTLVHSQSGRIIVVRYEDLLAKPVDGLTQVATHLGVALTPEVISEAVESATKAHMQSLRDPDRPPGEVNPDTDRASAELEDDDARRLRDCTRRYLKYSFGYDYEFVPRTPSSS